MKARTVFSLTIALGMGAAAVFLARGWMEQNTPEPVVITQVEQLPKTTVVVAKRDLFFGDQLLDAYLEEVEWPADLVPGGTYRTIEDLLAENRVVTRQIAEGEPVFTTRLSGENGRASLSTVVSGEMRAVTISVNDILGVAGFVLPGDRVDIQLTREMDEGPVTEILLQNVKVLGIDQNANDQAEEPQVARALTVEVTPYQAQKLVLAGQVGVLSLTLRNELDVAAAEQQRVTLADLTTAEINESPNAQLTELLLSSRPPKPSAADAAGDGEATREVTRTAPSAPSIAVTRGMATSTYAVRTLNDGGRALLDAAAAPSRALGGAADAIGGAGPAESQ